MSKADHIRELLVTEPRWNHEQIASQCGCTRRWVSQLAVKMRPRPAETDMEARLRALEQAVKDLVEHVKRLENRSNGALNYRPSARMRLRVH